MIFERERREREASPISPAPGMRSKLHMRRSASEDDDERVAHIPTEANRAIECRLRPMMSKSITRDKLPAPLKWQLLVVVEGKEAMEDESKTAWFYKLFEGLPLRYRRSRNGHAEASNQPLMHVISGCMRLDDWRGRRVKSKSLCSELPDWTWTVHKMAFDFVQISTRRQKFWINNCELCQAT